MTGGVVADPRPSRFDWSPTRRPVLDGYAYAEFPLRAAAFAIDMLLAAIVVFVASSIVARLVYPFAAWPEFEGTVPLEMLLLALVATLPTAVAAWMWRMRGATPGQRLFGLEVRHWLTGERLSLASASARWVLLYVPLTLMVAYPQVVSAALDTGMLLALVELPWLPFATMTLPVIWYLALAYGALVDRRRVRGLHDRVCGSVVVRAPRGAAKAASEQTDVDERSTIAELVPFSWFARVGLHWVGWLFIAGAIVVGGFSLVELIRSQPDGLEWVPPIAFAVGQVAIALLPAALLWRVRDTARRYPLLLIGLALAGLDLLLNNVARVVPTASELFPFVAGRPWAVLFLAAPVFIGLGLLTMRERGPTRPWLLLAIAALYLVRPLATLWTSTTGPELFTFATGTLAAVALAFAVWVPVSAWLDREEPRTFWLLLALALPLQGFVMLAGALFVFAGPELMADLQLSVSIAATVAYAAAAVLALLAYARFTPR